MLRLLIVDDEPIVLRALAWTLEREGHTVVKAQGGNAGVDAFAAAHGSGEPFDAVFTDLDMPDLSGHEVAHKVKTLSPATPVFLFTGWGRSNETGRSEPYIDRVLLKPAPLEALREALETFCKRDR